jgi:hypothetical protein
MKNYNLVDDLDLLDEEDEKDESTQISMNLIKVQRDKLKQILSFGAPQSEDEELEITVGDGCVVPRSLLCFKALVYDTNA